MAELPDDRIEMLELQLRRYALAIEMTERRLREMRRLAEDVHMAAYRICLTQGAAAHGCTMSWEGLLEQLDKLQKRLGPCTCEAKHDGEAG